MSYVLELDDLTIHDAEYAILSYIIENHKGITYKEIGKKMGITDRTAYRMAVDFGLDDKKRRNRAITPYRKNKRGEKSIL